MATLSPGRSRTARSLAAGLAAEALAVLAWAPSPAGGEAPADRIAPPDLSGGLGLLALLALLLALRTRARWHSARTGRARNHPALVTVLAAALLAGGLGWLLRTAPRWDAGQALVLVVLAGGATRLVVLEVVSQAELWRRIPPLHRAVVGDLLRLARDGTLLRRLRSRRRGRRLGYREWGSPHLLFVLDADERTARRALVGAIARSLGPDGAGGAPDEPAPAVEAAALDWFARAELLAAFELLDWPAAGSPDRPSGRALAARAAHTYRELLAVAAWILSRPAPRRFSPARSALRGEDGRDRLRSWRAGLAESWQRALPPRGSPERTAFLRAGGRLDRLFEAALDPAAEAPPLLPVTPPRLDSAARDACRAWDEPPLPPRGPARRAAETAREGWLACWLLARGDLPASTRNEVLLRLRPALTPPLGTTAARGPDLPAILAAAERADLLERRAVREPEATRAGAAGLAARAREVARRTAERALREPPPDAVDAARTVASWTCEEVRENERLRRIGRLSAVAGALLAALAVLFGSPGG